MHAFGLCVTHVINLELTSHFTKYADLPVCFLSYDLSIYDKLSIHESWIELDKLCIACGARVGKPLSTNKNQFMRFHAKSLQL